jgi:uncharacterized membrane protein
LVKYSSAACGVFTICVAATNTFSAIPPAYEIIDIWGGAAYAINNSGLAVGYDTSSSTAFLYENGVVTRYDELIDPASNRAWGINNSGTIVGIALDNNLNVDKTYLWDGHNVSYDIPLIYGWAINDAGFVAGNGAFNMRSEASIYDGTQTLSLAPGIGEHSSAMGINNLGEAVGRIGYSYTGDDAFLWSENVLNILPKDTADRARAADINDHSVAVGWVRRYSQDRAVYWDNATLHSLHDDSYSAIANAINNAGQIVGGGNYAMLWDGNESVRLQDLIPADSGWDRLTVANDINESGQIVGMGERNGRLRAFLLNPVPEPVTAALIVVGGLVMLRRL